jgi:tryptophan synthase beta chain
VIGLTGTGYFDMYAYQKHNDGVMADYIPTEEELAQSFARLPKID